MIAPSELLKPITPLQQIKNKNEAIGIIKNNTLIALEYQAQLLAWQSWYNKIKE